MAQWNIYNNMRIWMLTYVSIILCVPRSSPQRPVRYSSDPFESQYQALPWESIEEAKVRNACIPFSLAQNICLFVLILLTFDVRCLLYYYNLYAQHTYISTILRTHNTVNPSYNIITELWFYAIRFMRMVQIDLALQLRL